MKTVKTESNIGKSVIVCPFCNEAYVHIEKVEINAGGEITKVNGNGTKMLSGEPSMRGVLIETTYYCELGHRWIEKQQFHKGMTYVGIKKLQGYHPEYYPEKPKDFVTQDIWRD